MINSEFTLKVNWDFLYLIVLTPVFFSISFYLTSNYLYGDQVHYRALYDALSTAAFSDALSISEDLVSGSEPVTAWLLWIGASLGVDKDIYISLINVLFLFLLTLFLRREKASWFVVFLVLTNFYFVVLITGAERLKFGYLFVVIAVLCRGNLRWFFLFLAPFLHLQMIIFLFGIGAGYFSNPIKKFIVDWRISKKSIKVLLPASIFMLVVLTILWPAVFSKIQHYESSGLLDLSQVFILLLVSLFVTKHRFRIFLVLIAMAVFVLFIGGSRMNMVAFSLVLYFLTIEKRLSSPLFIPILIYFSYKSIGFVANISKFGNGFA